MPDTYCNVCGRDKTFLFLTRTEQSLCIVCAQKEGLCEICGSTRREGESADDQLHYEEECFK